ncbi:MAG: ammonia-forming cytochrome c nitrite reductase subunit c552 [Opitutaceae bacterium]|nr:ammonia-forming cytochrome c nitrite reductase subunit c552 [Verrucomicrobiales bacterium]
MVVEWIFIVVLLAGAGLITLGRRSDFRVRLFVGGTVLCGLVTAWLWQGQLDKRTTSRAQQTVPHQNRAPEYAGSDSCRVCHPDQYTTWHQSFHRTMTQVATPQSVRGNFDGVSLSLDGEQFHFERRGDEFWVEMPDPTYHLSSAVGQPSSEPAAIAGASADPHATTRIRRRISMTTGSHHMQAYWVDNGLGNQQYSLPFTYLFETERWVPRRAVFLKDPKVLGWNQVWNVGCIDCHATAGQPRQLPDRLSFDTRVAELGISCEACHGPAGEHVRLNSDPRRRYSLHHDGKKGDPSIVNPARLTARQSSEVCGSCHSIRGVINEQAWLKEGTNYRPGDELEKKSPVILRSRSPEVQRGSFWNDGMVRVSGRDYNGVLNSPCFKGEKFSCLSCHSMHQSSPTNQLALRMETNDACLQCHQSFAKDVPQHTHHTAGSEGSLCYNCHMPHTTYGLLKAIRSHQVSSPSVKTSLQTGRPNACNLCHLDKTLDWTSQKLAAWYKISPERLSAEDNTVAASILWTLKGDAGQRALIAWHMGWGPARMASNEAWIAPYLALMLDDPYAVVRYIAGRSLGRLPGFRDFSYDYIAAAPELGLAKERVMELWTKSKTPAANKALLIDQTGALQRDAIDELLKSRDNRVLELLE